MAFGVGCFVSSFLFFISRRTKKGVFLKERESHPPPSCSPLFSWVSQDQPETGAPKDRITRTDPVVEIGQQAPGGNSTFGRCAGRKRAHRPDLNGMDMDWHDMGLVDRQGRAFVVAGKGHAWASAFDGATSGLETSSFLEEGSLNITFFPDSLAVAVEIWFYIRKQGPRPVTLMVISALLFPEYTYVAIGGSEGAFISSAP